MAMYTMALTHRHGMNDLTSIYPDKFEKRHQQKWFSYLSAYFDFYVREDATELTVHMSGFPLYRRHLITACIKRGIILTMVYPKKGRYVHKEKMTPGGTWKNWYEKV